MIVPTPIIMVYATMRAVGSTCFGALIYVQTVNLIKPKHYNWWRPIQSARRQTLQYGLMTIFMTAFVILWQKSFPDGADSRIC